MSDDPEYAYIREARIWLSESENLPATLRLVYDELTYVNLALEALKTSRSVSPTVETAIELTRMYNERAVFVAPDVPPQLSALGDDRRFVRAEGIYLLPRIEAFLENYPGRAAIDGIILGQQTSTREAVEAYAEEVGYTKTEVVSIPEGHIVKYWRSIDPETTAVAITTLGTVWTIPAEYRFQLVKEEGESDTRVVDCSINNEVKFIVTKDK